MSKIEEIFQIVSKSQQLQLSEEELKSGTISKPAKAMFIPDGFQKQYDALPDEEKQRYKWHQKYYESIIDNSSSSIEDAAHSLMLTVKSGLSPADLEDDEKIILRSAYGKEWYREAGYQNEEGDTI